jgi:hypothetical protein
LTWGFVGAPLTTRSASGTTRSARIAPQTDHRFRPSRLASPQFCTPLPIVSGAIATPTMQPGVGDDRRGFDRRISDTRCDASADETSTAAADRRSIRADRVVLPSSLPTTGALAKPQVSLPGRIFGTHRTRRSHPPSRRGRVRGTRPHHLNGHRPRSAVARHASKSTQQRPLDNQRARTLDPGSTLQPLPTPHRDRRRTHKPSHQPLRAQQLAPVSPTLTRRPLRHVCARSRARGRASVRCSPSAFRAPRRCRCTTWVDRTAT